MRGRQLIQWTWPSRSTGGIAAGVLALLLSAAWARAAVPSRILLARQPRLIEPSEIAGVVAFLCGEAAATITGTTISPDLGTTAQ